jgi:ribonuclease-3
MTFTPQLPLFHNPLLLQQALTHKSYRQSHPDVEGDNERLEFLGDAVLDFLSAEFYFKVYPNQAEGELTALRAALVSEPQLAQFAIQLGLGEQIRLGQGVEIIGGRQNPNILSSAFEALIGAYFLDCGSKIEPIRDYVLPFFELMWDKPLPINFKSQLQEWALGTLGQLPEYLTVSRSGPDHAPEFMVQVCVADQVYGIGKGRKKQEAEKAAAQDALQKLSLF